MGNILPNNQNLSENCQQQFYQNQVQLMNCQNQITNQSAHQVIYLQNNINRVTPQIARPQPINQQTQQQSLLQNQNVYGQSLQYQSPLNIAGGMRLNSQQSNQVTQERQINFLNNFHNSAFTFHNKPQESSLSHQYMQSQINALQLPSYQQYNCAFADQTLKSQSQSYHISQQKECQQIPTLQNYSIRKQTDPLSLDPQEILQQQIFKQQISQYRQTVTEQTMIQHQNLENYGGHLNQLSEDFKLNDDNTLGQDSNMIEQLLEQKKMELAKQLMDLPDSDQIVLWSKNKIQYAKSKRGSRFRGVSKNGKKWQVQLLGNMRKRYIGSISSEDQAAKIYDHYAIITHGLRAKTNFHYDKRQIQDIMERFRESDFLNPGANILRQTPYCPN
ncbi:ant-like protein [Stylonychia lemnae]|uniref:Ant-like protein n=1 Tax=Stylonychia lemnae TaxID=5949 RepID=A0A078AGI2_STYLE|nr:ant-like protein [Stylonychia lemnae]|eukprot:CDW81380.1 ant-like protein [Stylonychia lemnae]